MTNFGQNTSNETSSLSDSIFDVGTVTFWILDRNICLKFSTALFNCLIQLRERRGKTRLIFIIRILLISKSKSSLGSVGVA